MTACSPETYARSLLSLKRLDPQHLRDLSTDFEVLCHLSWETSGKLHRFFTNPDVEERSKKVLLTSLSEHLRPATVAFLEVLVSRGGFGQLRKIVSSFDQLYNPVLVTVSTPLPVLPEQKRKIKLAVQRSPQSSELRDRSVEFRYKEVPTESSQPWAREFLRQLLAHLIDTLTNANYMNRKDRWRH